jgi:DNA polymerase III delta prime subunit
MYLFNNLSDLDFECLTRDLLAAHWGRDLEVFPRGPDGGVDVRAVAVDDAPAVVVQCKHFENSSFSQLRSSVTAVQSRWEEMDLCTDPRTEFYLSTTLSLTAKQKDKLISAAPSLLSPDRVLGRSDVEALLRAHREVERAYTKLWLPTGGPLEALLRAKTVWRSREFAERLPRIAKTYVQCNAHDLARAALEARHAVVISGPPGIGKTTLASILASEYASEGFEVIIASADIAEAEEALVRDRKQVVFYDDFLGKVASSMLVKNEDARLAELVRGLVTSTNHRLILTSREYILRDAILRYDDLAELDLDRLRIVVDVGTYSPGQRARLTYNEAFHSRLRKVDLSNLELSFADIVTHQNFSPRLLDVSITRWDAGGLRGLGDDLGALIIDSFNNPTGLWEKVFEAQLTDGDRVVLFALFLLGTEMDIRDLRKTAASLDANVFREPHATVNLEYSLRRLDGTFVTLDSFEGTDSVGFANPSVIDFLIARLSSDPGLVAHLVRSVTTFRQAQHLLELARKRATGPPAQAALAEHLAAHVPELLERVRSFARLPDRIVTRHPSSLFRPFSVSAHVIDQLVEALELQIEFDDYSRKWWDEVLQWAVSDLSDVAGINRAMEFVSIPELLERAVEGKAPDVLAELRAAIEALPPSLTQLSLLAEHVGITEDDGLKASLAHRVEAYLDSPELQNILEQADVGKRQQIAYTLEGICDVVEIDHAGIPRLATEAAQAERRRAFEQARLRTAAYEEAVATATIVAPLDVEKDLGEVFAAYHALVTLVGERDTGM